MGKRERASVRWMVEAEEAEQKSNQRAKVDGLPLPVQLYPAHWNRVAMLRSVLSLPR